MAILSEISGRGHIKHCPTHGCVHLTYQTVTLHIANTQAFVLLARAWMGMIDQEKQSIRSAALHDPKAWIVELEYRRTVVRLFADEAIEVGTMLAEAFYHLTAHEDAVPENEWPEGDVFVTIPDLSQLPRSTAPVEK